MWVSVKYWRINHWTEFDCGRMTWLWMGAWHKDEIRNKGRKKHYSKCIRQKKKSLKGRRISFVCTCQRKNTFFLLWLFVSQEKLSRWNFPRLTMFPEVDPRLRFPLSVYHSSHPTSHHPLPTSYFRLPLLTSCFLFSPSSIHCPRPSAITWLTSLPTLLT